MRADLSRRDVLHGAVVTGALATAGCSTSTMPGQLGGADLERGHRLRDRRFPPPASDAIEEMPLVIAGGGIAGLAAGWRLAEAGFWDFTLLELEDQIGGNARSGSNAISAFPLGAHYLPVPNREAGALRHMLRAFEMIVGDDAGAPVFDPYQLCADLEERLLWRGRWQEGLVPRTGLSAAEKAHWHAFDTAMANFKKAIGSDGRPAFAIPSAYSSQDGKFTALDRESFAQWMDGKGWTSGPLRAYVRYCCRDDYGTEPEQVSAWAGIHYFAGRRGWAAHDDGDRELTWPEGNGRLVAMMTRRFPQNIRSGQTVFQVREVEGGALVDSFDHKRQQSRRLKAKTVILAMPDFIASRVQGSARPSMSYVPWIVANVSVAKRPAGKGTPLAWDNVSTAGDSLGYVVATHQTSSGSDGPTVLTWYLPLSEMKPADARELLLERSLAEWQAIVQADLLAMNPDLAGAIISIDVWRWGHAMVQPKPGFLTDAARLAAIAARPPILRAHSDLSGLSLFEEAHYHGVVAAEQALSHLGFPFESLI